MPNETGTSWQPTITVTFNHPVDPSTLTAESFRVRGTVTGPVVGSLRLSPDGRSAEFHPDGSMIGTCTRAQVAVE
ncbi:MAG: Ig-like domain-containing protein [Candidatus Eisenbacteria sp.]|nr:Ig-like domain-containing protein [Candidatus Eisenbacteria bacterium]